MPIHSMQVTKKLRDEEQYWFLRQQTWFDPFAVKLLLNGAGGQITSSPYPHIGIRQAVLSKSPKPNGYLFLSVVMNLQSLALGQLSVDLFNGVCPSITDLEAKFDQALQKMAPSHCLPGLMDWSVKQVHYAVDIHTPHVAEYGKLFKRAFIPAGFRKSNISPGIFFARSDASDVELRIYDKASQLNNEGYFPWQSKLVRKAQDRLRIEVQCSGNKLYHIRRCFSPQTHKLRPAVFLDQNTANAVLQDCYRQVIGYADFHSLPQALNMVREGPGRKDRKDQLSDFLRLLMQSSTVEKALQGFLTGTPLKKTDTLVHGSQRSLEYYMNNYLPELNIHSVLLPSNMKLPFLANPMPVADRLPQK